MSRRLVDESRQSLSSYFASKDDATRTLSTHPEQLEEARAARKEKARRKALAKKRAMSDFIVRHEKPWRACDGGRQFGYQRPAARSTRVSLWRRQSDDDAPSGVVMLKQHLAENFLRVKDLFRKWDVNCDGLVSRCEMIDAIGALGLAPFADYPRNAEAFSTLFDALDRDASGYIDFSELHHALRHYHPPPIDAEGEQFRLPIIAPAAKGEKEAGVPRPPPLLKAGSAKDIAIVASLKRVLGLHQQRVMDCFRSWDYDEDSNISPAELRRALCALSIPVEPRAVKLLFRHIDADGSGAISFAELNDVLRRVVDFDVGKSETFDARRGVYTTSPTHVTRRKGGGKQQRSSQQQQPPSQLPSLPEISTSVAVMSFERQGITLPADEDEVPAAAVAAKSYAAGRARRESVDLQAKMDHDAQARRTRAEV